MPDVPHDFNLQRKLNRRFLRVGDFKNVSFAAHAVAPKGIVFLRRKAHQFSIHPELVQQNPPALLQGNRGERRGQITLQGSKATAHLIFSHLGHLGHR
ncbi:hypothetical protein [Pseudomonas coronafaciens]|uniref:hypothetical protein n=1 Tax=Pseudomonas coronafaciens TaxID=53409 RepID=UPI001F41B227|nr:hypothetical protein [Pseudomonas coronafaciens]